MKSSIHAIQMKLFSSIAAASVVGAAMLIAPSAAEAKDHYLGHHHGHHELRKIHHDFRHDVRAFDHLRKAYNHNWHHIRRDYNHEVHDYPQVIPTHRYNYHHPGIGVEIRF